MIQNILKWWTEFSQSEKTQKIIGWWKENVVFVSSGKYGTYIYLNFLRPYMSVRLYSNEKRLFGIEARPIWIRMPVGHPLGNLKQFN